MNGVDVSDRARANAHDDGLRVEIVAFAPHALEPIPIRDAGRREDGVVVSGEIGQRQGLADVEAELVAALALLGSCGISRP